MNYDPNNDVLPDADYRGPWTTQPLVDNRPTFAEELDSKCSEMEYQNTWSSR